MDLLAVSGFRGPADNIYFAELDRVIETMDLKTPVGAPTANACFERLIGTIRRECLDFMIPLNERHSRPILREWVSHYNRGGPHLSPEPGIPDSSVVLTSTGPSKKWIPIDRRIVSKPILGGLHHEYWTAA
jgi:putative transposase